LHVVPADATVQVPAVGVAQLPHAPQAVEQHTPLAQALFRHCDWLAGQVTGCPFLSLQAPAPSQVLLPLQVLAVLSSMLVIVMLQLPPVPQLLHAGQVAELQHTSSRQVSPLAHSAQPSTLQSMVAVGKQLPPADLRGWQVPAWSQ
jgi:hypothetical protein